MAWGVPVQGGTEVAVAFHVLGRRHQAFMLLAGRFLIPFPGRTQLGLLRAAASACEWQPLGEHTLRGNDSDRTNAIVGGLRGLQVLPVGAG